MSKITVSNPQTVSLTLTDSKINLSRNPGQDQIDLAISRIKSGERKITVAKDMGISVKKLDRLTAEIPRINPRHLSVSMKEEISRRVKGGESRRSVAIAMGVGISTVSGIASGLPRTLQGKALIDSEVVKEKAVKCLATGDPYKKIMEETGVTNPILRRWAKEAGLPPRRVFGGYPDDIKQQAIARVEAGETKISVAKDLGIPETAIRQWTQHIKLASDPVTPEQVQQYLDRVSAGELGTVVSRELGLNAATLARYARKSAVDTDVSADTKRAILKANEKGTPQATIAKQQKLSRAVVALVVKNATGKNLRQRYTDEQRAKAIRDMEAGLAPVAIANEIGCSLGSVLAWHKEAVANGIAIEVPNFKAQGQDPEFSWVAREYANYSAWIPFMTDWLELQKDSYQGAMKSLSLFIKRYLHAHQLPGQLADILRRDSTLPDFYKTCCKPSDGGVANNNHVHRFLEYVLKTPDFCDDDENFGNPVTSPMFRNPIPLVSGSKDSRRLFESVRDPLPYAFICDLRECIAQGPNFRDWTFVQNLMGRKTPAGKAEAGDWFEVDEDRLDKNDPDCVWRIRRRMKLPPVLEMWSPVRWVIVLLKLQLPARTGQIRMSDSGESDYLRYENGHWIRNEGELAHLSGTKRHQWSQGMLKNVPSSDGNDGLILYFNSNKTKDRYMSGKDKGQLCEWPQLPKAHENPYIWIEKLRNWQEKYNPISGRTRWEDIPATKGLGIKHEETAAEYPDGCFLFRAPENKQEEHLPHSNSIISNAWEYLLKAYEKKLSEKNVTHPDGSPILMFDSVTGLVKCPPHGLRVSLITHLIIDGNASPELMMKIVGHTRLIMTLYYTKYGVKNMQDALMGAAAKLDQKKDSSISNYLANAKEEEMRNRVVFNAADWTSVLALDPSLRNPIGWLYKHDGVCLAGGNTGPLDGFNTVPGCHNGGPQMFYSQRNHEAVPGGPLNCCRCRWFAAEKRHGPGLTATLNNKLFHLHEEQEKAVKYDIALNKLKTEKAEIETLGEPFSRMQDFRNSQRLFESTMSRLAGLMSDVHSLICLLERIKSLPDAEEGGMALAAVGDQVSMHTVLEETNSELLQLCGICGDVEIYPDLNPGTAAFKRAQILDAALEQSGKPACFMKMSEEDMLLYGNEFIRSLATHANPNNNLLGLRTVVEAIDSGQSIEALLNVSLKDILPNRISPVHTGLMNPIKLSGGRRDK